MERHDINKLSIIEKLCHGLVLTLFCLNTFFNYAYIAQLLDTKIGPGSLFIQVIYIIGIVINSINTIAIIINIYINFTYRNLFKPTVMEHECIMLLISISSGIFSVTYQSVGVIGTFNEVEIKYEKVVFIFVTFLLLIVITWLLIHINSHRDYGEQWQLSLSNMITIEMTLANLLSRIVVSIGKEQISLFVDHLIYKQNDVLSPDSVWSMLQPVYDKLLTFNYKFEAISCIFAAALLIDPLRRHYTNVQHYKVASSHLNTPQKHDLNRHHFHIPTIIICTIVIAINVISLMINTMKYFLPIQSDIVSIVTYIIAIINCYYMYKDIVKYSFKKHINLMGSFLLWLGTFGQVIEVISYIQHAIHSILINGYTAENIILIVMSILFYVHCLIQNIVIASLTERNCHKFNHTITSNLLKSPLILFVINVMYLVQTIYLIHVSFPTLTTNYLFVELFEKGFGLIGIIFAMLHRSYSAVILLDYIK